MDTSPIDHEPIRSALFQSWRLATSSSAIVGAIMLGSAIWAVVSFNTLPKIPVTPPGSRHDNEISLRRKRRTLGWITSGLVLANFLAAAAYARVYLNTSKDELKQFPLTTPYLATTWAFCLVFLIIVLILSLIFGRKQSRLKTDIEKK
jgi:membrane protease YdiL (CAAX protease family)